MRTVAMDAHRDFCEVVVKHEGKLRRIGRLSIDRKSLEGFASTLGPDDHVVLESTSFAWPIAELMMRHAGKVTVSNPMKNKAIASAKVKSDKVDARVLADLGDADLLAEVWIPDPKSLVLRRTVMYRQQHVRHRTRLRQQVSSVLQRNLLKSPHTDLLGKAGREWLAELVLPPHERVQVDSLLRIHDAFSAEVQLLDASLAEAVLDIPAAELLMSIPGVGLVTAVGLHALIGDITRFKSPQCLVGYLGLDPRVRQSGNGPFRTGHISKQGQSHARCMLVEAAHSAVRTPGPLHAFYERLRAKKGSQIAAVAVARKLTVITWHMLTNGEEYRYGLPSLTGRKMYELERTAGRPRTRRDTYRQRREQERALLDQAERSYRSHVRARASHRERDSSSANTDPHSATGSQSSQPALRARARSRPQAEE